MKTAKTILAMVIGLVVSNSYAEQICFIAMNAKTGEIVAKKGDTCDTRLAPCSTFKIPLSLMGYEAQILQDEMHPEWPFTERADGHPVDKEKQIPFHPKSWMSNSIVWYSQVLTQKLGSEQFKSFVEKFDYGNKDITGDKGKNNGLTNSWLSPSLKISPQEQLIFLSKIVNRKLPLSQHTYDMTQSILLIEELGNGWKYYGKTGTGEERLSDGTSDMNKQLGWIVGWIQKEDHNIVFALSIKDAKAIPSMKERQNMAKGYLKEFGLIT